MFRKLLIFMVCCAVCITCSAWSINRSYEDLPDTDTQLTEEQVEDFVGGMVTGNTETLITVTYVDGGVGGGLLNFVVTNMLNTITCPDANATEGTAITFADTGIMTITESADTITFDATEVDGSTTNEINTIQGDADTATTGLILSIDGGEGIDTSVTGDVMTVAGEDATDSNKGVASFVSAHFSVASGAVSVVADGIDDTLIDWGFGANQVSDLDIMVTVLGTPAYTTVRDHINLFTSAGRISGGEITQHGGDATVDVAAGTGVIRIADDDSSAIKFFTIPATTEIGVAAGETKYIVVDYNTGTEAITVTAWAGETWDKDTEFPLGKVVNDGGTLHIIDNPWWVGDALTNIIERFEGQGYFARDERGGGLILSVSDETNREIAVTGGKVWSRLNEFDTTTLDTNITGTFHLDYESADGVWTGNDVTAYTVDQWNDVVTTHALVNLTNNYYMNMWVYVEPAAVAGDQVHMVYGQSESLKSATIEAEAPPTNLPAHITENCILVGRILIKEGVNAPVQVDSVWGTTFSASQATDHTNLSNLVWTSSGHTGTADSIAGFATTTGVAMEVNTFAELNTIIADKTLVNEEDITLTTGRITDFDSATTALIEGYGYLDAEVDGSVTNELNIFTTPDTEATEGTAITFADTGIMTITEDADTITFDATEADTLDTACDRGAVTDQTIDVTGIILENDESITNAVDNEIDFNFSDTTSAGEYKVVLDATGSTGADRDIVLEFGDNLGKITYDDGEDLFIFGGASPKIKDNFGFMLGTGTDAVIRWRTSGNDKLTIETEVNSANASGNIIISENNDSNTDWGHAVTPDPKLILHSSDETTVTDYMSFTADQTGNGNIEVGGTGDLNINFGDTTTAGTYKVVLDATGSDDVDRDVGLYFNDETDASIVYNDGQSGFFVNKNFVLGAGIQIGIGASATATYLGFHYGSNYDQTNMYVTCNNASNSAGIIHVVDEVDLTTNWGQADVVDPHMMFHSADATTTTDYVQLWADQTGDGNIEVGGTGNLNVLSPIDMSTNKIVGVVDPDDDQDAATKKYVDDQITANTYTLAFASGDLASSVLTVTHNLTQKYVHVSVYDDSDEMVIPTDVTASTTAIVLVDLTDFTVTGTWNVRVSR